MCLRPGIEPVKPRAHTPITREKIVRYARSHGMSVTHLSRVETPPTRRCRCVANTLSVRLLYRPSCVIILRIKGASHDGRTLRMLHYVSFMSGHKGYQPALLEHPIGDNFSGAKNVCLHRRRFVNFRKFEDLPQFPATKRAVDNRI